MPMTSNSYHIRKIIPREEIGWESIATSQQRLWDSKLDIIRKYTAKNAQSKRQLATYYIVHPSSEHRTPLIIERHELCGVTTQDDYQIMFLVPENREAGGGTDVTLLDSRVVIIHGDTGRVAYSPAMVPIEAHTIPVMKWLTENEEWGFDGCEIPWVGEGAVWPND